LLRDEFHERVSEKTPQLPWIAGEIATAADGALQRAGIYQQKIHVLSEMNKTIACSIEAAQRVLGYRPAIALEEGMRRSLRWIYERGGLNG
jgi:nucleoside-diphosphate-sugar epimerase